MINSLTVKNVATYDQTGIQITDLKKINFIYGANGSGKTTLSNLINSSTDPKFADCSVVWEHNIPIKALVYNKVFRDNNFGRGSIDGVFTLGQASKEEIEAVNEMRIELETIKARGITVSTSLNNLNDEKQKRENEFKETIWIDAYKKHEYDFKEVFSGVMKKEAFKAKFLNECENNKAEQISLKDLLEKGRTVFGKTPTALPYLSMPDYTRLSNIESDKIWGKKIIGKSDVDIACLIQRLNLNDWVNQGRKYIDESGICPFCQQITISEQFKKQLDDYFDDSFTEDIALAKRYCDEYVKLVNKIEKDLRQIEETEKNNSDSKLNIEKYTTCLRSISIQFMSNKELLSNKIKEPSRSIPLISVHEELSNLKNILNDANAELKKHNDIVSNYTVEKNNLIAGVWRYLVDENMNHTQLYYKKVNGLKRGIKNLEERQKILRNAYRELDNKIKEAHKNVTSVQPSVDEINKILRAFGFNNFKIVPSTLQKNQYQIQRADGTIAESTLSEGEITFITFLYYLQLSKGSNKQESVSEERVLVVDDPISSLDSNVLFVVSSLLKEIIKSIKREEGNIKQLILLTHNVYFHKEVSFIDGRTSENGETNYWILRRNNNITTLQNYGMENPIQNSYELLWGELINKDNNSGITIQNTMRRILENYFKILGKYCDDELISKFSDAEEQEICRSLICWINDGSHCIPDDIFIEYPENTIDKYYEIFKKIFINMGHFEHYNMMMRKK